MPLASTFSRRLTSLALFLFICTALPAQAQLYNKKIAIPPNAGASLKATAQDAATTLQRMTGQAFETVTAPADGSIVLMRSTEAPADIKNQLARYGSEPFVIRSSPGKLLIAANRDQGLQHGLYFYLDQLGCRWYLPNENWTIIPSKTNIEISINRLVVPDFNVRGFFGTGGFGKFGANRHYDANDKLPGQWELWKQRNRFGGEYRLGGHTGEAFNQHQKQTLIDHPEYMAEVDGKRVPWSVIAKFDPSNRDVLQLYIQERINTLRLQRRKDPNGVGSESVSVEPADGGGFGNSGDCLKIGNGSVSDQVFYIANETAKAVAKETPPGRVNLLAYYTHGAVPSFPLEPNVFVQVVPYGFNRTGLTPEELIKAWHKKVPEMGIYDYWSIPDWQQDMPTFNFRQTPRKKLALWHENGVVSYSSESTFSAGAMGPGWLVASRLMWDLKTDENALLEEFYMQSFGPAAPPMRRMMERWAKGFMLTSQELALSLRDMQEAIKLGNTPAIKARLADYARYVHYLQLRYQWQHPEDGVNVSTLDLTNYLWSIYDSAMIHSFRLCQLLGRNDEAVRAAYAVKDKNAAGWTGIKQITDDEALRLIGESVDKFQPLDYEERQYSSELVPLKNGAAHNTDLVSANFLENMRFEMQIPEGKKTLPLKVTPMVDVRLLLMNSDGENIFDATVTAEKADTLQIPLPAPGRYTLQVICKKRRYTLEAPRDVAFTAPLVYNSAGQAIPRLYMFVPRGLKTIAVYSTYQLIPDFYDSDGKKVTPRRLQAPGITLVDVPAGQDGKVWALGNVRTPRSLALLNIPQVLGFYPDEMLVPQDVLQ